MNTTRAEAEKYADEIIDIAKAEGRRIRERHPGMLRPEGGPRRGPDITPVVREKLIEEFISTGLGDDAKTPGAGDSVG